MKSFIVKPPVRKLSGSVPVVTQLSMAVVHNVAKTWLPHEKKIDLKMQGGNKVVHIN